MLQPRIYNFQHNISVEQALWEPCSTRLTKYLCLFGEARA